ncbi:hypothetical protein LG298_04875 [Cytobacillus firmus]
MILLFEIAAYLVMIGGVCIQHLGIYLFAAGNLAGKANSKEAQEPAHL